MHVQKSHLLPDGDCLKSGVKAGLHTNPYCMAVFVLVWKREKAPKIVKTGSIYCDKNLLIWPLPAPSPYISHIHFPKGLEGWASQLTHTLREADVWTSLISTCCCCVVILFTMLLWLTECLASGHTFHVNNTSAAANVNKDIMKTRFNCRLLCYTEEVGFWMWLPLRSI